MQRVFSRVAALAPMLVAACGGDPASGAGAGSSADVTSSATSSVTSSVTSSGAGGAAPLEPDCRAPEGEARGYALRPVATGLDAPVFVGASPGDAARLYVLEKSGAVRVIVDGALRAEPFLLVGRCGEELSCGSEQGLLGLAFHPEYALNGRFFVNFTDAAGDSRIVEYARSPADPDRASPAPVRVLVEVDQPFANHNGGGLAFGPDGFLYAGFGDGGSANDPQGNGQNLATKLGKLLRLDVDSHPAPPGNLAGDGVDPAIWDYGLRNPWRFDFDPCSGDLFIADVGQNCWEEINVEPKGQGNRNWGWGEREGNHCFDPAAFGACPDEPADPVACGPEGASPPALEYSHEGGACSVTGGVVYRGAKLPGLRGRYLYADYCAGFIRSFAWRDGAAVDPADHTADLVGAEPLFVSSFGRDAAGEVYLADYGGGRVLALVAE